MTSKKSSEIFVSGASGWLGKELISLINQKRLIDLSTNDLRLFSSNGRSIKLINSKEYLTSSFEVNQFEIEPKNLEGYIHLAFLTRDKLKTLNFNDFIRINLELISKACQIIERNKPKWVVVVSSGAILDRESGEIESDVEKNPYGFCKRIEELLLADAAKRVGANIVIGRLWGASGEQMPPNLEYALSDFIESARLKNEIQIKSGGEVFRRYVDAGEFMEVLVKLAISGESRLLDSGGVVIEIGELSQLVAGHFPGTSVSRSKSLTDVDDYYPKEQDFNDLAKELGIQLRTIKEQVARTVNGHIRQAMN
jgi:nucleoside-diphosphate-sugar epimerase